MKRVFAWDVPLSAAAAFTLSYGASFMFIIRLPARDVFWTSLAVCLLLSLAAAFRKALVRVLPFLILLVPLFWLTKAYEPLFSFFEAYAGWIFAVRPNPGFERLSLILLTFAITTPVFILIRCGSPAFVLMLAGGALFFGLENAEPDFPFWLYWVFLLVILLQMSHTAWRSVLPKNEREPEGAEERRAVSSLKLRLLAALPACLLAVLAAGLFTATEADPLGFFRNIGDIGGIFPGGGGGGNRPATDVTGIGRDMGGPFFPTGQLMLTLRQTGPYSPEGPYLRGGIGAVYDGRRWYGDGLEGLALGPQGLNGGDASAPAVFSDGFMIQYEGLRGTRLYLPYDTFDVTLPPGLSETDPDFDDVILPITDKSVTWLPREGTITKGYSLSPVEGGTVRRQAILRLPMFPPRDDLVWYTGNILRLAETPDEALSYWVFTQEGVPTENPAIPEESPQDFLQLPANLPYRVRDLAYRLTVYGDDFYDALSVERYLVENFAYNPDMPGTPDGEDFVDYFLFRQQEGYCTYFASAMAVLCRAAGLPARYVDGFAPSGEQDQYRRFLYTDEYAHAWTEVWISGRGWVRFEPTPAYNREEGPVWFPPPQQNPKRPVTYPPPAQEPSAPPPLSVSPGTPGGTGGRGPSFLRTVIFIVVLPPLTLYLLWLALRLRRRRFEKMLRSLPYGQKQARRIYSHTLWLIGHAHVRPAPHETLGEFADRVDTAWPTKLYATRRLAEAYGKSCYADGLMTAEESGTLRSYVEILEKREPILLGRRRYWLYKKALSLL